MPRILVSTCASSFVMLVLTTRKEAPYRPQGRISCTCNIFMLSNVLCGFTSAPFPMKIETSPFNYWPFVRAIPLAYSLHKGPAMRKKFSFHDIIVCAMRRCDAIDAEAVAQWTWLIMLCKEGSGALWQRWRWPATTRLVLYLAWQRSMKEGKWAQKILGIPPRESLKRVRIHKVDRLQMKSICRDWI